MKTLIILLALVSINVVAKPVNINSEDAQTISKSLLGIGPKKAKEIIRYRKINGPFKSASDLTKVKGIGIKTVEKNKNDILLSKVKVQKKPSLKKTSK